MSAQPEGKGPLLALIRSTSNSDRLSHRDETKAQKLTGPRSHCGSADAGNASILNQSAPPDRASPASFAWGRPGNSSVLQGQPSESGSVGAGLT